MIGSTENKVLIDSIESDRRMNCVSKMARFRAQNDLKRRFMPKYVQPVLLGHSKTVITSHQYSKLSNNF